MEEVGQFESGSRVTQLFNVQRDPWETTDLSFLPESREVVASMRAAMRARAEELGDNPGNTGEQCDFWDTY